MMEIAFIPQKEFERVQSEVHDKFERLQILSDMCRLNALSAIKLAGSGHLGSTLSSMDILVILYLSEMSLFGKGFQNPNRDIFFSSKGHDVPAQYAVLMAAGFLDFNKLLKLRRLDGLDGHPDIRISGMEANTGSLGMGISKARGIAFAKKLNKWGGRVFVMTGDGELQEGQIWESLQTTAHQKINNVNVIVDANKVQTDQQVNRITGLRDLKEKFNAFGWHVEECDGHNFIQLDLVLSKFKKITDKPKALIAHTIKGKGISFMEAPKAFRDNQGVYPWHSGAPANESYRAGKQELVSRINAHLDQIGKKAIHMELVESDLKNNTNKPSEKIVSAYGEALVRIAGHRKDIVVLDGDLASDCGLVPFREKYPERFVENGIAEQDMVSMAGGMALQGLLPIVNSFGVFLASRANEQIYNNATEETKIIYVCHYAGLLPAGPGKSHQSLRDISLFGALPNCISLEPCNGLETELALDWCVNESKQNCLLRLSIFPPPGIITLPQGYKFVFGKGVVVRKGKDAVIFCYGPVMVHEAILGSESLAKDNIALKVVNMPWLNRIDQPWFEEVVGECKAIFVLDNHAPVGGLGDCVLNAVSSNQELKRKKFRKLSVEGFPACGTPNEVLRFHRLDGESLASRIRKEVLF